MDVFFMVTVLDIHTKSSLMVFLYVIKMAYVFWDVHHRQVRRAILCGVL